MRVRVLAVTTAAVLSLALSGCLTVHGEDVVVPATTEGEAKKVLDSFVTSNNKASRTFDTKLGATVESGALGAIDQAGLKARKAVHEGENPSFQPIELTDARFHIPQQAGWPKFFVADAQNAQSSSGSRWLVVFTRDSLDARWKASYLSVLAADAIPQFATDEDGYLEDIPVDEEAGLTMAPQEVGAAYTGYLKDGKTTVFASGEYTDKLREERKRNARTTTVWNDFIDQPAEKGAFAPVALRTKDGSALVFFSSYHHQKQTAAEGLKPPPPDRYAKALMTGTPKRSITYSYTAEQVVSVPKREDAEGKIAFLHRLIGLTSAEAQ